MKKIYSIAVTVIAVILLLAFSVLFVHADYDTKVLVKLGLKEKPVETNWALSSWESCLNQLDFDADIAFFGNSITRGGDFQDYFKDKKIVNLGYSGDSISGMTKRVPMVKAITPEKVFLMSGINNLHSTKTEDCINQYSTLLKTLREALPNAEIYVQSVLPISQTNEKNICSNSTIKEFNKKLEELCSQNNITYIDLFSLFIENNELKTTFSKDGLHINSAGYDVWADAINEYIY